MDNICFFAWRKFQKSPTSSFWVWVQDYSSSRKSAKQFLYDFHVHNLRNNVNICRYKLISIMISDCLYSQPNRMRPRLSSPFSQQAYPAVRERCSQYEIFHAIGEWRPNLKNHTFWFWSRPSYSQNTFLRSRFSFRSSSSSLNCVS